MPKYLLDKQKTIEKVIGDTVNPDLALVQKMAHGSKTKSTMKQLGALKPFITNMVNSNLLVMKVAVLS